MAGVVAAGCSSAGTIITTVICRSGSDGVMVETAVVPVTPEEVMKLVVIPLPVEVAGVVMAGC